MNADETPIGPPPFLHLTEPGPPSPPSEPGILVPPVMTPARSAPATWRGPHVQTFTGGHWYSFTPQPEDVRFADLRALSQINRYGGHTLVPYNDAEHMVRVARRVRDLGGTPLQCRGALGHDAHEYVPPADQLGPFLRAWSSHEACALLGLTPAAFDGIAEIVQRAKWATRTALDIVDVFAHGPSAALIKQADMELLATERRDLMAQGPVDWGNLPDPLPERIVPWTSAQAWAEFQAMWESLGGRMPR